MLLKLCMEGIAAHKGTDLFVLFISNEEKKIPLWCQKASKGTDGLVIWDYHVICIQSQKNNEGNAYHLVWDLDSSLPCPIPLKMYIAEAILAPFPLNPRYSRLFRVVHAPVFLQYFASDRSHMKDPLGDWISPPPSYEPIVAADGTKNNLDEYIQMCVTDIASGGEALINGVYSSKYGVVISESMFGNFFSQQKIKGKEMEMNLILEFEAMVRMVSLFNFLTIMHGALKLKEQFGTEQISSSSSKHHYRRRQFCCKVVPVGIYYPEKEEE